MFSITAYLGYTFASSTWMVYAALIPGAMAGLTGPAIQGIASIQAGSDQQGELQGGLVSTMSLASIISPPMMTHCFGYFSSASAPIYFPGAAFVLAAGLTATALLLFIRISSTLELDEPI